MSETPQQTWERVCNCWGYLSHKAQRRIATNAEAWKTYEEVLREAEERDELLNGRGNDETEGGSKPNAIATDNG
jgi:hypothetical protein